MASALVRAHILGEQRLRRIVTGAVARAWRSLPAYNEADVDEWLLRVLPLVAGAQRQSVALTEAYLARSLDRRPIGINPAKLIGSAVRNGTPPEDVYRRPFVTLWSSLADGKGFEAATAAGLARATSTAAMDVQLAARATFGAVQGADDGVYGYQRVADGGACEFCQAVDGAYVKAGDAMALHNNCGCSLEPLTAPHPRAAKLPDGVAVHEHGELGPMLGSPDHDFTSITDI